MRRPLIDGTRVIRFFFLLLFFNIYFFLCNYRWRTTAVVYTVYRCWSSATRIPETYYTTFVFIIQHSLNKIHYITLGWIECFFFLICVRPSLRIRVSLGPKMLS